MDAGTLVDAAQQAFFDIAGEGESSGPERLSKLLSEELLRLEAQEGGSGMLGVPTGYEDLDKLMSGLQPSELIILAARPSMGKTALALNLAEQVAFGGRTPWHPPAEESEQRPVGIFSLEMSKEALALRLISSRSGVDAQALRTGELTKQQWEDIREACDELYNAPMYIDDSPGLTILQLRAKARRMKDRFDIQALFIDYLQLLTAPGAARESRQVEVSTISRQIKSLARELKIPVVCLAQLNRGAEQRERNRPRMSDLRESGSIEQDADVIMLLHREAYYHKDDEQWMHDPENEDKINLSEVIIAKQRNGPTGVVKLTWDGAITRFKTMDQRPSDPYGGGYGGPGYGTIEPPPGGHPPAGSAGSGGAGWASSGGSSDPRGGGYTFAPGQRSGPVDEHRDGGRSSKSSREGPPPS
ncbi:MAG: replicative DNA helicase, partial [Planctomycetota bacterium]